MRYIGHILDRMTLRRAAALQIALQERRGTTLFHVGSGPQLAFSFDGDSAVREFARAAGPPYAPLFRLLGNEEVPLRPDDPFLAEYRGKKESSLLASEPHLKARAQDLVRRLKTALDTLAVEHVAGSAAVRATPLR